MTTTITKRGYWCLRVVYTSCQGLESDGRNFLAAIVHIQQEEEDEEESEEDIIVKVAFKDLSVRLKFSRNQQ
jgi:hypothetical protein